MANVDTDKLTELSEDGLNIKSLLIKLIGEALPQASQDSLIEALAYLNLPDANSLQRDIENIVEELEPNRLPYDTFPAEEIALRNAELARGEL